MDAISPDRTVLLTVCLHPANKYVRATLYYWLFVVARDNGSLVAMFRDGDTSRITMDQLKALEKVLPDSGQVEVLTSYSGDKALLGTAEDFFIRLLAVKQ